MTLLEGPTFGPNGNLYLVDVTAPPGAPKVLRINPETGETTTVYTDDTSAFTSAQFSPRDGRLYMTDFMGGTIQSITSDGDDPKLLFSGPVQGTPMNPDDIAFDKEGNLLITDARGSQDPYWKPQGRLIHINGVTAEATVLAQDLPAPNGIAFTSGYDGLWVTLNTANRIDYLRLDESGQGVLTAHPGIHVDAGVSQVDSAAVDADGNLYVGLHNRPAVLVYDAHGELVSTITIPGTDGGLSSATNIAIKPGTTDAYATVSGEAGGWLFTFNALGEGIRQSNGG
ncbi:SMP-30/gluconolactonase/LRE family protein [Arthrobacter sp. BE255]|uniref:SMP-30/gluconolactonase/LRE family protein n=1 Tax=Arthrobacter sp. BE255 TaxID=2817721 RepID=UPI0028543C57|nr:SMP-30/gluconolactonase/LRE family protein [Arthrobacter sp. BE255]MDR7159855.1 lactonase [Arthrobacter sp. BE255]